MIAETHKEIGHAKSDDELVILIAKKKMLDQAKNAFLKELRRVWTR